MADETNTSPIDDNYTPSEHDIAELYARTSSEDFDIDEADELYVYYGEKGQGTSSSGVSRYLAEELDDIADDIVNTAQSPVVNYVPRRAGQSGATQEEREVAEQQQRDADITFTREVIEQIPNEILWNVEQLSSGEIDASKAADNIDALIANGTTLSPNVSDESRARWQRVVVKLRAFAERLRNDAETASYRVVQVPPGARKYTAPRPEETEEQTASREAREEVENSKLENIRKGLEDALGTTYRYDYDTVDRSMGRVKAIRDLIEEGNSIALRAGTEERARWRRQVGRFAGLARDIEENIEEFDPESRRYAANEAIKKALVVLENPEATEYAKQQAKQSVAIYLAMDPTDQRAPSRSVHWRWSNYIAEDESNKRIFANLIAERAMVAMESDWSPLRHRLVQIALANRKHVDDELQQAFNVKRRQWVTQRDVFAEHPGKDPRQNTERWATVLEAGARRRIQREPQTEETRLRWEKENLEYDAAMERYRVEQRRLQRERESAVRVPLTDLGLEGGGTEGHDWILEMPEDSDKGYSGIQIDEPAATPRGDDDDDEEEEYSGPPRRDRRTGLLEILDSEGNRSVAEHERVGLAPILHGDTYLKRAVKNANEAIYKAIETQEVEEYCGNRTVDAGSRR